MTRLVVLGLAFVLAPIAAAHDDHGAPPAQFGGDTLASGGSENYEVNFYCPDNDAAALLCPIRVLDREDVMGQPRLVIHPEDVNVTAFNAIHGGPGIDLDPAADPPNLHSRNNLIHQPHTTFRSTNPFGTEGSGALDWQDQPYYSPLDDSRSDGSTFPLCPTVCPPEPNELVAMQIYGMDNALAIDDGCVRYKGPEHKCRLYEASLYAYRNTSADPYSYTIFTWKQKYGPEKPADRFLNRAELPASQAGNQIDSLDLAYVPGREHVVAVWRETAAEGGGTPGGPDDLRSWIGAAWTDTGNTVRWTRVADAERVGPCRNITNAVSFGDSLFVGCVVEDGYSRRDGARPGEIDLYRLSVPDGHATFVSTATVQGQWPRLAVSSAGHLAIAATEVDGTGAVHLAVSYSDLGFGWSEPQDFGADFQNATSGLRYARVQALAYHEASHQLFALYLERVAGQDGPTAMLVPEFAKVFGVVHESGRFMAKIPLNIGNARAAVPPTVEGLSQDVFDDRHDDIVLWTAPDGVQRIFVAYADYGEVLFAEVVQEGPEIGGLGFGQPPPPGQAAVDPNTVNQAMKVAAGVAGGILAGALALRMLLARSKRAVEAPSLGGK